MPGTSDTADALPLVEWGGSCQNPLKRTLRLRPCFAIRPLGSVITPAPAGDFSLMVNDRFPPRGGPRPKCGRAEANFRHFTRSLRIDSNAADARSFKLSENLTRIRVEYGQNARGPANRTFKPPC